MIRQPHRLRRQPIPPAPFVIAAALAVACAIASAQGPSTYVYDAAGRLLAVVAPSGEAAVYEYDLVGNLLSITRTPANTVSVMEFAPRSGPVGTTVRIYGTAFSPTPSLNAVTFDGTPATVSSASATELIVTVPSGASTGTIGVTSPNGSASSAIPFTVSAGTAAPEITIFSPVIGLPGATVTIDGLNFEGSIGANAAALNVLQGTLTAASAIQLSMTVPVGATSGRISVATPNGIGTSTDDFFVPPAPYGPGDVSYTSRIPFGTGHTATISTANTIGLLLFDGEVGQRVSLRVGPGVNSQVKIIEPMGTQVATVSYGGVINAFIDTQTLIRAGTYTIVADPGGSSTGNLTLTLYDVPPDVTGTMSFGTGFPVTITTPGQNARLTFAGAASQRVSLSVSAASGAAISIRAPDDSVLASGTGTALGTFIDTTTLPAAGTHSVVFDPSGTSTGTTTLTLYDVPADVSGSITAGGSGVGVSITTPGQNGLLTFSGTAGQRVSLRRSNGLNSAISILRPDGSTQASATAGASFNAFVDTITLAETGTYSVAVDPIGSATGSATLTLYDVPADLSGTLTVNGSAVAVAMSTPGQNAAYTFSGTASQQVTVKVTGNNYGSVTVRFRRPDGTVLTTSTSSSASFNLAQQTLPTTGTYTVEVDPATFNTGTLNLSVTTP